MYCVYIYIYVYVYVYIIYINIICKGIFVPPKEYVMPAKSLVQIVWWWGHHSWYRSVTFHIEVHDASPVGLDHPRVDQRGHHCSKAADYWLARNVSVMVHSWWWMVMVMVATGWYWSLDVLSGGFLISRGTPSHHPLTAGFSIINHPSRDTSIYGNPLGPPQDRWRPEETHAECRGRSARSSLVQDAWRW